MKDQGSGVCQPAAEDEKSLNVHGDNLNPLLSQGSRFVAS